MSDAIHAVCPHCGKTNRLPAARTGQQPDCGAIMRHGPHQLAQKSTTTGRSVRRR